MQAMLRVKTLQLPTTYEQTKVTAGRFATELLRLQTLRSQPHSWNLLHNLATKRAAYEILCWRMFRINELPNEVLERIFASCLSMLSAADVHQWRMKLMEVCSKWLDVIINTPQLYVCILYRIQWIYSSGLLFSWSTIYINTHPPFTLARLCVARAKAHRLNVYLDQRDPNWTKAEEENRYTPQHTSELMAFVSTFLERTTCLIFICDTWANTIAANTVLETLTSPSSLRRIELLRTGNAYTTFRNPPGPPPEFFRPCKLFQGMPLPALQHVHLNGVFVDFKLETFRNLRVLELVKMPIEHMPSLEELAMVLESSPRLSRLVYNGACAKLEALCQDGQYQEWKPTRLPYLRELSIVNLISTYAIFATKIIDAPGVRHLSVGNMTDPEDSAKFIQYLINRYPNVTILTVELVGAKDFASYALWLSSMPLRYLKVARIPEEFFEALLSWDSDDQGFSSVCQSRVICPQLEAFHVTDWKSIDVAQVERLLKVRRDCGSPLSALLVSTNDIESMGDGEKLWARQTGILHQVPPGSRPELHERYGL